MNEQKQAELRMTENGRRRSILDLPEGPGKQFIQGSYDCITFLGE
jgi:hypothetical protein